MNGAFMSNKYHHKLNEVDFDLKRVKIKICVKLSGVARDKNNITNIFSRREITFSKINCGNCYSL